MKDRQEQNEYKQAMKNENHFEVWHSVDHKISVAYIGRILGHIETKQSYLQVGIGIYAYIEEEI